MWGEAADSEDGSVAAEPLRGVQRGTRENGVILLERVLPQDGGSRTRCPARSESLLGVAADRRSTINDRRPTLERGPSRAAVPYRRGYRARVTAGGDDERFETVGEECPRAVNEGGGTGSSARVRRFHWSSVGAVRFRSGFPRSVFGGRDGDAFERRVVKSV